MPDRRPNVVLLMTDQQRWDTVGCAGGPVETPNLDWLASRGTRFTSAYSATPSCIPARASLMTGQDPWHTGILGMGPRQPRCGNLGNTLPQVLADDGYYTVGVGKMHFSPQRSHQGFHHTVIDETARQEDPDFSSDYASWFRSVAPAGSDRFEHGIDVNSWMARPFTLAEHLHATNWTAMTGIQELQRRDPSKPFFLKLSFARPHSPYDPPPYYFDLYDRRELPPAAIGSWAGINDVPSDAADPNAWRGRRTDEEIHRARAGYYGSIMHIDHQIGRFMIEMRRSQLIDNTIFVFTSDHGDMLGDHHLWRKTYAYEGSAHVPMIVTLPASMRGGVSASSDAPVTLQDIMPTILDGCGIEIPDSVDGRSLIGECRGDASGRREFIHGEHSICYHPSQEMQYLTDGKWKYIWFPRTGVEQLFDLTSDRYECVDLAASAEHRDELSIWRSRLVGILSARDAGLTSNGQLVRQDDQPALRSPAADLRTTIFY
ncbi:MAG TPA: arylsulfatase [Microlunatus sp.]